MSNPSSITVSLEKAKELKEAGWPQDNSAFYWIDNPESHKCEVVIGFDACNQFDPEIEELEDNGCGCCGYATKIEKFYAAPTSEEILRRLPSRIVIEDKAYSLYIMMVEDWYNILYWHSGTDQKFLNSQDTLANAAASCYCQLSTNNLL